MGEISESLLRLQPTTKSHILLRGRCRLPDESLGI